MTGAIYDSDQQRHIEVLTLQHNIHNIYIKTHTKLQQNLNSSHLTNEKNSGQS